MDGTERERRFEQLAELRASHLQSTAYLLVGSWPAAQDLVQDALVTTWQNLGSVVDPEALEGYVRTVLVRKAMRWRQRVRDREVLVSEPPDSAFNDVTSASDDRDELRRRLFKLSPRERAMVVLRYYENMSEIEVAAIFDCPVGTVKSTTSRALSSIRPAIRTAAQSSAPDSSRGALGAKTNPMGSPPPVST